MSSDFPVHPGLGTVAVGVDGSPSTAVLWVAAEAARRGRSLYLVHAADTDRRAVFVRAETLRAIREAGRDVSRTVTWLMTSVPRGGGGGRGT
ncbi:hypothetical protein ACFY8C_38750 [Streptomyces flavochromogenes]|jgi:hypothetical protein|uniref:Universal stress protein n=1 Tax=Streptomyces flavochromogenes TaxID=68199 RepID=A0ABW6Y3U0_9ACTN|nr:hypothetical protein [Streptomyces flavochromogenes]